MILENFKKIIKVDAENNAYELLSQIWVKMGYFGANKSFQILTLVTSYKISEKFIQWILRSEQTRFLGQNWGENDPV